MQREAGQKDERSRVHVSRAISNSAQYPVIANHVITEREFLGEAGESEDRK